MRRLFFTPLLIAVFSPVLAEVDPTVHEMCLGANDYKGCVELNKKTVSKANKWEFPNLLDKFKKEAKVKQPTKQELKERCLLGNETGYDAGLVGVIEMVDECISVLTEVGPTVLTIDPLTHAGCPSGGGEGVGAYLACVTSNSDWKIPTNKKDLTQAAAKSECTEYGSEFKWDSKTGNCKLGSRTVEEIRESGDWPKQQQHVPTGYRRAQNLKQKRQNSTNILKAIAEGLEMFSSTYNPPGYQPNTGGVITAPNNYQPPAYSSPAAPQQPSQIRVYNNTYGSSTGVQTCNRFGNTNSFTCN